MTVFSIRYYILLVRNQKKYYLMYSNKRTFAIYSPQLYLNALTKQKTNNNRGMCVYLHNKICSVANMKMSFNAVKMLKFNIDV